MGENSLTGLGKFWCFSCFLSLLVTIALKSLKHDLTYFVSALFIYNSAETITVKTSKKTSTKLVGLRINTNALQGRY